MPVLQAGRATRFRLLAAFLPPFGDGLRPGEPGDDYTAQVLPPTDATVPDDERVYTQEPIVWRPLVLMGPNRVGFVGEELVWYAGDSQDRGGLMPDMTVTWAAYYWGDAVWEPEGWGAVGVTVNHAFLSAGIYRVDCTVTNNDTGQERTGIRYVRVYQDRQSGFDAVVDVQSLTGSQGGWTVTLGVASGDTSDVRPGSRVVLYVTDYAQLAPGGPFVDVSLESDQDSGYVVDGEAHGRYDPHVVFNGLVTGLQTTESAQQWSATIAASTPEVLLRASEMWPTDFFDTQPDETGTPYNITAAVVKGDGVVAVPAHPRAGYVLEEGILTAKDAAYTIIAQETNWADHYDLSLWTAEAPLVNAIGSIRLDGDRWTSLTGRLWSEFAVLFCGKKGMAVARVHPNMWNNPPGGEDPVRVLFDGSHLFGISVAEAATTRVAFVQLSGVGPGRKSLVWRYYKDEGGAEHTGEKLLPPAQNGKWLRLQGLSSTTDPVAVEDAPLRYWAKAYFAWQNARYPKLTLDLGQLHFLEPYDLIAVSYQGRQG